MIFSDNKIETFRKDTPGCDHCIHLNNAGAGLMPQPVIDAIKNHIDCEARYGGYEAAEIEAQKIDDFYGSAAKLLNCHRDEIAFTANATDSFDRAISSIPFEKDDVIVTTNEDYISNQIVYLSFKKRFGINIVRAKSLTNGGVDLEDLEKCIKLSNPKLLAITHIPTNSGLVQPVEEIGSLCSRYNTLYLVDACQSIGQLPIDIKKIKCDFLSTTSRKFLRGPRGAGFLFVSKNVLDKGYEPLFIDMRGADWVQKDTYIVRETAMRFEDWEFAYALLLGTGAAIDYALSVDIAKIEPRVKFLARYMRNALQKIPGVSTFDKGIDPAAIVTFNLIGGNADTIKNELLKRKINSVTSIRNFAVIDYDEKQIDWTIRVSPHYYNTTEEIDNFIEATKEIAVTSKALY